MRLVLSEWWRKYGLTYCSTIDWLVGWFVEEDEGGFAEGPTAIEGDARNSQSFKEEKLLMILYCTWRVNKACMWDIIDSKSLNKLPRVQLVNTNINNRVINWSN